MSPQVDGVLSALADERRREVLRYLSSESADGTPVQEVADHLATRTDDTTEEVMINLQHATLPQLADRNLLEYDRQSGVVQYQSDPLAEEVLTVVTELQGRRHVRVGRSSDRDASP